MDEHNQRVLDKACMDNVDSDINHSVTWYILASYAYDNDDQLLSKGRYERLAKLMLNNWDKIDHKNKDYISEDDLRGMTYEGEYPKRTELSLRHLQEVYFGRKKHT
jgi:hypothetical protein